VKSAQLKSPQSEAINRNLVYHDFGNEFDASISRKFADHYAFLLKGGWFDGDSESTYDDTTRIWVQFTANF
jgi:hypothetical protein